MTQPIRQDLTCYKGQTFSQDLYFKCNGQPMDLTGATAKAQIRPSDNSEKLTAEFTCAISATEGKLTLSLSAEVTADLLPGFYVWDLKIVESSTVSYWLRGKFVVDGRVTV